MNYSLGLVIVNNDDLAGQLSVETAWMVSDPNVRVEITAHKYPVSSYRLTNGRPFYVDIRVNQGFHNYSEERYYREISNSDRLADITEEFGNDEPFCLNGVAEDCERLIGIAYDDMICNEKLRTDPKSDWLYGAMHACYSTKYPILNSTPLACQTSNYREGYDEITFIKKHSSPRAHISTLGILYEN